MHKKNPQEVADWLFRMLTIAMERKNQKMPPEKQLHITQQTDIPGEHRIDVDYPIARAAIKNRYVIRIVIHLEKKSADFALGYAAGFQTLPLSEYHTIVREANRTIRCH